MAAQRQTCESGRFTLRQDQHPKNEERGRCFNATVSSTYIYIYIHIECHIYIYIPIDVKDIPRPGDPQPGKSRHTARLLGSLYRENLSLSSIKCLCNLRLKGLARYRKSSALPLENEETRHLGLFLENEETRHLDHHHWHQTYSETWQTKRRMKQK